MRFIKGMVVLGLAVSFCMAAPLSISGTVIDSLSGAPISGAKVKLETLKDSTTTSATGTFTIGAAVATINNASEAIAPSVPVMSQQGEIRLSLQEPARVTITSYSAQGKQLGSMQKTLGAGNHSIMPAKANSGVCLYQVAVNGKTYTLQQANLNGRAYTKTNASGSAVPFQGLSKSSARLAFSDDILVSKAFYASQDMPITDSVLTGLSFKLKVNDRNCPLVTGASTTDGGYVIANNLNSSYTFTQSLYMCSNNYWYVIANIPYNSADKTIRSFPNVQFDLTPAWQISLFHDLTIDFTEVSPHTSNKLIDAACVDLWINGVGTAGSTEIGIWNDAWYITPPGTKVTTTPDTVDGKAYNVYTVTSGQQVTAVTLVPVTPYPLTFPLSMNLLAFTTYAISKSYIATTSGISQIAYGFKIVSTNGIPSTFLCSNFMILYD